MAGALLSIASQALNTAETALMVTANDTANSNNPNFVNETANLSTGAVIGPISDTLPNVLPSGVMVSGITSASDPVLSRVIQQHQSSAGYWNQLATEQSAIQPLFNEPQTGGLQEMLAAFGHAWTTLADHPGSSAEAASVLQSGKALANTIQSLQGQLAQQATSITQQLSTQMATLATTSQTIANANGTQASLAPNSQGSNQLQAHVASALHQLASAASIQTLTSADGSVQVSSGGIALVSGTTTPPANAYQVHLHGTGPWYTQTATLSIAGAAYTPERGAIAGNLAALQQIQSTGQQLAQLSQALAKNVPTGNSASLTHLFSATTNGALTIASGVTASTLHASASATALAAIQTATQSWTYIVGQVASAGNLATTQQTRQQADLAALQTQQQSVQGVNLNQAAATTAQEQEAYQAAAKLVQVQQSVVNTLLTSIS